MPPIAAYVYKVATVIVDPTTVIREHAEDGWRLHSVMAGFFDRVDRWHDCGFTVVFERAAQPRALRKKALQQTAETAGVA